MAKDRWEDANRNLARAVTGVNMTARIEDRRDHDCSLTFQKTDGQLFTVQNVDIGILEDRPSPKLEAIIAEAKAELDLMTELRGFKYKLSVRLDGQCDLRVWVAEADARAVPIWQHTDATPHAAERNAKDWIQGQPRRGGR